MKYLNFVHYIYHYFLLFCLQKSSNSQPYSADALVPGDVSHKFLPQISVCVSIPEPSFHLLYVLLVFDDSEIHH